ncbi:MAG: response regulator [Oligoflexia bacterium]|nr:response regulator [Oligoflexia bacterium]
MNNYNIYKKKISELSILLVDDSQCMHEISRHILEDLGAKDITTAYSGNDAWKIINKLQLQDKIFDLIISDWSMSDGSGIELLKKIRSTDLYKNIPFFMLTAEIVDDSVNIAQREGVSEYITKPFSQDTIVTIIKKYFEL